MSLNHSPEMHQNIIARIPSVTGRELREWFMRLESGPPFSRCEERAHWLSDEHGLSHGYASAGISPLDLRGTYKMVIGKVEPRTTAAGSGWKFP